MSAETNYVSDNNGNKCYVDYYGSLELAQAALDSLIDCRNCRNCSDCRYCRNCIDCIDCIDCRNCSDCRYCRNCIDCIDCIDCRNCRNCSNCSYCRNCRNCIDCIDCRNCRNCSDCIDCIGYIGYIGKNDPIFDIPKIEDIHQKVYLAASQVDALDMAHWHVCETTHCRAGWVVFLAGEKGARLEKLHDTCLAAQLIYRESSPLKVSVNRFFDTADVALADMKRLAEEEKLLGE